MNNKDMLIKSAEAVSMFCRLNINMKKNIPIRSSEMGLLILIVKSDIPITPIMAANFFKVSKPMIASMAASLIKKQYIDKIPSTNDRRSYILSPKQKAIDLVELTYEEYLKVMQLLIDKMGEKRFENLIELLEESNSILLKGES